MVKTTGPAPKKPKGLLRAIWTQLCLEQKGVLADALGPSVFDGRRNAFTPIKLPIAEGEYGGKTG